MNHRNGVLPMNDIEQGKENFQKAFLEVCKDYLENLELAPEEDVFISPKLQRKMNRLLKEQQKPYWKLINTPLKKVIAACLAVLVLTGAAIGCVMVKEPIFEFFTEVYEKFSEFFFESEKEDAASDIITEVHTLTYVPEGYELVESPMLTDEECGLYTIWKHQDGSQIMFRQSLLVSKITIDTEEADTKIIDQKTTVVIVQKNDQTCVFWNDELYSYKLICNFSEDEIVKMIKSMK